MFLPLGDTDAATEPSVPFRDLICYQCYGDDCPAAKYPYPVSHLVIGCQLCYKQWDTGEYGNIIHSVWLSVL